MSTLLEIEGLSHRFARRRWGRLEVTPALEQVSLRLEAERCLALVGESGGGKTTLVRIVLGLLRASEGRVALAVEGALRELPLRGALERSMRRSVQLISQDPAGALDPAMRVGEAIAEGYLIGQPQLGARRRRELVLTLIDELGLRPEQRRRHPGALSGGERRRVVIARALAALGFGLVAPAPGRLLVADEPTAGLDAVVRDRVLRVLEAERARGLSLLLVSHDIDVVRRLADDVAIIHRGRIVEQGPAALLDAPTEVYSRELVASSRLDSR